MTNPYAHSPFDIPEENLLLWQNIVNMMSELLSFSAGLIMRINDDDIEVFVASQTKDNPYTPGFKGKLENSGMYCEEVLRTRGEVIIPNALKDEKWKNNPALQYGLISYMGYPIRMPDGSFYGTICVLNRVETSPTETSKKLMMRFRDMIEMNIQIIVQRKELEQKNLLLKATTEKYKKIEQELSSNTSFLDNVIDSSPLCTMITDSQGTVVLTNPACLEFFGILEEDFIGKYNILEDEIVKFNGLVPSVNRVFEEGRIIDIAIDYSKAKDIGFSNPSDRIVELIFTPIFDDNGHILNVVIQMIDLTDIKNAEKQYIENDQKLRAISNNMPGGQIFQLLIEPNGDRRFTYISSQVEQLYGCSVEEVLSDFKILFNRIHHDDIARVERAILISINEMSVFDQEVRIINADNEVRWHRLKAQPRKTEEEIILFDGIDIDITEHFIAAKKMEGLLFDLNERIKELRCLYGISKLIGKPDVSIGEILQGTVELIPESWQFPEVTCARIIYQGREFKTKNFKLTKWNLKAGIYILNREVGIIEVCYLIDENSHRPDPFLNEEVNLLKAVAERLGRSIEFQNAREELNEKNARLEKIATHDYLTGLPNRMLFYDRFSQSIMMSQREKRKMAICIADIDNFKKINDEFGHQNGDQVLKEVALRARLAMRTVDTIARFGGDEFSILIQNIASREDIETIAERILKMVNQQLFVEGNIFEPSMSIGIAIYPDDGIEHEELIRKADKAMYKAKSRGKNRFSFFDD